MIPLKILNIIISIVPMLLVIRPLLLIYNGPNDAKNKIILKEKIRIIKSLESNEFEFVYSQEIIDTHYIHRFVGNYDINTKFFDLLAIELYDLKVNGESNNEEKLQTWTFSKCVRLKIEDQSQYKIYETLNVLFNNFMNYSIKHKKLNEKIEKLLIQKFGTTIYDLKDIKKSVNLHTTKNKLNILLDEKR